MTYAFTFDAAFCSGCKACQAACKDKNRLPLGVLWRRVIEVSGGTWRQEGAAWQNMVFAYNLSLACNHCLHPKCAGVCPTGAYDVRADGIVLLDTTKCMGCGYCAWACPYGAPQYDPVVGCMTKCNFCFDELEQGLPPACVAACPLRVLGYAEDTTNATAKELRLWEAPPETHPYPLPVYSHSQPRLAIKPHTAMATPQAKFVANVEEIQPRTTSAWEEMPLILFTLFTQIAVGGFWAMLWTFPRIWAAGQVTSFELLPSLVIGICLAAGMLASLAHLGTKRNAWRALGNLRKSWLSREIFFTGLFGIGWSVTTLTSAFWHRSPVGVLGLTAALGLGLVYSMPRVYRLPAVPAWNTWKTNAVFMVSTLLLGQSAMTALLSFESNVTGVQMAPRQWLYNSAGLLILLLLQLLLMQKPFQPLRLTMLVAAMALTGGVALLFGAAPTWLAASILVTVLLEEGMGRWFFYRAVRRPFASSG